MSESLSVKELDSKDDGDKASLVEELVPMVLNHEFPDQVIYINSLLDSELHEGMI